MEYQALHTRLSVICCLLISSALSQDMFFLTSIDCYKCIGSAANSSCSDPFTKNDYLLEKYKRVKCNRGACMKRVFKSGDGELKIMRTCTNDMDFRLPLVNNVCQQESDGFGYLCMCGRNLCNSAVLIAPPSQIGYILGVVALINHYKYSV